MKWHPIWQSLVVWLQNCLGYLGGGSVSNTNYEWGKDETSWREMSWENATSESLLGFPSTKCSWAQVQMIFWFPQSVFFLCQHFVLSKERERGGVFREWSGKGLVCPLALGHREAATGKKCLVHKFGQLMCATNEEQIPVRIRSSNKKRLPCCFVLGS